MGRLFWKFFIFIWLVQIAGIFGTGFLFWLDRQQLEARLGPERAAEMRHPAPPPDAAFARQPIPADGFPPRPHGHRPPPLPVMHIITGLLASLLSAAGLAWYVAKPIRQLKGAFAAAADGDLQARVGDRMGRRRDELADLGRDFDRMASRLSALMEGQKRLLHDVSHELRSPLARLHAAIGLARQQPARLDDSMTRLEREGERMNRLVGELLTLSRLEAGVGGALEEIDPAELLLELIDDARFEGAPRHVTVDAAEMPDLLVRANGELLQRALENVLRNALRYSPDGGVVRLEMTQTAHGRCRICVLDQGPGVAEDQLEKIFMPFFRGEGQSEGYGLGLAIARRVLDAVNGEIRAKNRSEGGLAVEIELPLMR